MDLIANNDYRGFTSYMNKGSNTICGKSSIQLLMQAIKNSKVNTYPDIEWIACEQSNKVRRKEDSSISYASAVVYI